MREQSTASAAVWQGRILEAISKIRSQKQRPNEDRIFAAIRQQYHNVSNGEISQHLDKCVNAGLILRVINKGINSYKDASRNVSRKLTISNELDLTKAVIRAVREMKNENGSSLKEIEKYLNESRVFHLGDVDLSSRLKSAVKVAAARGLIVQEGKLYRAPPRKDDDSAHGRRKKDDKETTPKVKYFPIGLAQVGPEFLYLLFVV